MTSGGEGLLASGQLWLRLMQALYTIFHDATQLALAGMSKSSFLPSPCRVQFQLGCPGLQVLFSFG